MSDTRIYLSKEISINSRITLPKEASHHILRVLRLKIDTELTLFDGNKMGEYTAKLAAISKGLAEVTIQQFVPKIVESPINIHLGQVISRGEKMDFTIQKSTELGVNKITPLFSERCNVNLNPPRLQRKVEHWQKVAIAASEQSGRIKVPTINQPENLVTWLNHTQSELKLLLSVTKPDKTKPLPESSKDITILIGPEGGFSLAEEELAKRSNFKSLNLGPRILRTETAALTTISILQTKYGDFKI